jgi:hypothetical protein
MRLAVFLLGSLGACAQSGIQIPTIGAVADSSGFLRMVQGVAGNFLLGPPVAAGVLTAACSERLCLAKTGSKILSETGETGAPPGSATFALHGDDALVFFHESRTFAHWREDTLKTLDWMVDGEVLSMRFRGERPELAVRRDGNVWIVHPDGAIVDTIAEAPGPVLLLDDGVLFATSDQVILRRDGSEMRFELAGARSISAVGPHYAAIRTDDAVYVLRTESGREGFFLLPGTTP